MANQLMGAFIDRRPLSRALAVAAASAIATLALSGCASLPSMGVRVGSESRDWPAVMRLGTGSAVRVEDIAGNAFAGRFVHADHGGVTMSVGPSPQTVVRANVQRLFLIQRLTATKAKRGWLIGTVAGGLVGAFSARSNRVPWTLFMSAGWGAFGAGIGASDGFFDRKETLVYEAHAAAPASSIRR